MRELKFRAFDPDLKAIIYGDDIEENKTQVTSDDPDDDDNYLRRYFTGLSYGKLFVGFYRHNGDWEECKLMQFTGLLDKNGKEIYEGDILSGHGDGDVEIRWGQTEWWCSFQDGEGIALDEMCIWFGNNSEVTGNIYENPELIQ